ncbi:cytadherence high molecular weight protein 1-like isoform X3 [Xiphias gladius]|uniref:cytadherence high molecular weight protein 1-like isoform X3 n=1 Tax=Xiphias gladius TaxID=8245 RepID=UPI001A9952D1|nr:cytadherence high molecular weight protein 1-like isoform X3 [Xiphias gladius]
MKTLVLLPLSFAVALAVPPFPPSVAQNPDLPKEDQSPLLGDWVPLQGHVEVEDPAPQARLVSKDQQEKLSPVPVEMEQSQSQSVVELQVKLKPDVKVEQDSKAVPEVKVEQEGKENPEVKVEQELKAEPEVKPEPQVKVNPEPEVNLNPDVMAELEVNVKPEVEMEPELKVVPEVKVEQEGKENPEVKVEQELKAEPEVKPEPQVKVNPEPEVNLNPDVMAELEVNVKPVVEMEPELKVDLDSEVESEVKVEPYVQMEPEPEENPMRNEVQEEFQVQMNLEAETERNQEIEERHIDMERNYESGGEPIMELEPLDDNQIFNEEGGNTDRSEVENSLRAAFQSQDPVIEPLPEDEGFMRKRNDVLEEEPILETDPEMGNEPFQNQEVIPDVAIMEEGPALDIMGERMSDLENNFPNEEARMGMEPEKNQDLHIAEGLDSVMMGEPGREFVSEEELPDMLLFKEPAMENSPALDGGAQVGWVPEREERTLMRQGGWSVCPGVQLEGKCYEFVKGPMSVADAEFFCQAKFPGGHLASITSPRIQREVMNMILRHNGAHTRTWIGGLRYLETNHFIWLDGSHWGYADWLSGEPSNAADVEDCLELLPHGNGKFNDFTCREPQPFICSYLY